MSVETIMDGEGNTMGKVSRLTREQIEEIQRLLLQRKEIIEKDLRKGFTRFLDEEAEETTVVDVKDGEESHVDVGKELSFQVMSRRSHELKQIKEALLRLEGGEYGICDECGRTIRFERLKAMPFAKLCRNCQYDSERSQRDRQGIR